MPGVTAAITTYDRRDMVVEAVESVLAQTYEDMEILVVDNGSTDGTEHALAPYRERIRYVWQENAGRAGARNAAIALAHGKYIAFLDSDDLWLPDKLARQVPLVERDERIGMVHGHVELMDNEGQPLAEATATQRHIFERAHRQPPTYAGYALDCLCLTSTIMLRRAALEDVGGYDPSIALEDLDLYLRIARRWKIAFDHGPALARYRFHDNQTASEELTRGQIQVCRKHLALLDDPIQDDSLARRNLHLTLARCYHVLADGRRVRRALREAAAVDPRVVLRTEVWRRLALSLLPRGARLRARRLKQTVARHVATT